MTDPLRANVMKALNVARCKTTEARVSRLRAFIGELDWDDLAWLRENSAPERNQPLTLGEFYQSDGGQRLMLIPSMSLR
jgi:hypothetical protein